MKIIFDKKRLGETCNSEKECKREWGEAGAKKVGQRLKELAAADTLQDMWHIPAAGFHALHGDREGQYAVSLHGAFRLVFEAVREAEDEAAGEEVDLSEIRKIRVLEVTDYH